MSGLFFRFDQVIAKQFAQHPERELFESFPGAGPVYAPRLLVALGTDSSRWASSADLLSHSGITPVTEKSGNSCRVHRRLACFNFIRQTFHESAARPEGAPVLAGFKSSVPGPGPQA